MRAATIFFFNRRDEPKSLELEDGLFTLLKFNLESLFYWSMDSHIFE